MKLADRGRNCFLGLFCSDTWDKTISSVITDATWAYLYDSVTPDASILSLAPDTAWRLYLLGWNDLASAVAVG